MKNRYKSKAFFEISYTPELVYFKIFFHIVRYIKKAGHNDRLMYNLNLVLVRPQILLVVKYAFFDILTFQQLQYRVFNHILHSAVQRVI